MLIIELVRFYHYDPYKIITEFGSILTRIGLRGLLIIAFILVILRDDAFIGLLQSSKLSHSRIIHSIEKLYDIV